MTLAALAHRMAQVGQPRSSSRKSWTGFVLLVSGDGSIILGPRLRSVLEPQEPF